eukprot:m.30884 g.30884  ORF g.30884 m.30884 type:complete len:361 (-) comp16355_c1_seq1:145-1227(-)
MALNRASQVVFKFARGSQSLWTCARTNATGPLTKSSWTGSSRSLLGWSAHVRNPSTSLCAVSPRYIRNNTDDDVNKREHRFALDLKQLSTSASLNARVRTARAKGKPDESDSVTNNNNDGPVFVPSEPVDNSIAARLDRSQLQTLEDKGTRQHIAKVYGTTASNIGFAGAVTATSLAVGFVAPMWIGLVGIVPLIGFYMTDINTSPLLRGGLVASFLATSGLSLTPLIGFAMVADPMIVPLALGGTMVIMAGTSAGALLAPRASMIRFAPVLGGGAMLLLGAGLFGMGQAALTGAASPILGSFMLWGGFALAIGFTAYDTQNMIEEYRAGNKDVLRHSVDVFINFLMIFKRLLFVLLDRD